jgi:hypothetical protein
MPPDTLLDPPAIFALVVEEDSAAAAHVVFEFYLGILLHVYLDRCRHKVVPSQPEFLYFL